MAWKMPNEWLSTGMITYEKDNWEFRTVLYKVCVFDFCRAVFCIEFLGLKIQSSICTELFGRKSMGSVWFSHEKYSCVFDCTGDIICDSVIVFILTEDNLWLEAFEVSDCDSLNVEDVDDLVECIFNQEQFIGR